MQWQRRVNIVYTAGAEGFVGLVHGTVTGNGNTPSEWSAELFTEDGGRVLVTRASTPEEAQRDCDEWLAAHHLAVERDPYPSDVHRR